MTLYPDLDSMYLDPQHSFCYTSIFLTHFLLSSSSFLASSWERSCVLLFSHSTFTYTTAHTSSPCCCCCCCCTAVVRDFFSLSIRMRIKQKFRIIPKYFDLFEEKQNIFNYCNAVVLQEIRSDPSPPHCCTCTVGILRRSTVAL